MATWLRKLTVRRVALVDAGANQEAFVNLFKRDGDMADKDTPEAKRLADLEAQVGKLTKAAADAEAAKAKAEKDRADEVAKAADAKKTAEEKAKEAGEAVVALRKQLDTATQTVEKIAEEREVEKFTAIAKSVPHLGKTEDAVKELRAISKAMGAEGFQEYLQRQRGIAEQLRQSNLFKAVGADGEGDGSASGRIQQLAKKLQAEDQKLTPEQAFAKALDSMTPEEYAAYRAESYVRPEGGK